MGKPFMVSTYGERLGKMSLALVFLSIWLFYLTVGVFLR